MMMMPRFISCWLALALLVLSAGGVVAQQPSEGSPAAVPAAVVPEAEHRLSPGDTVEVTVFQEEDLGARLTLNRLGRVSLPLIGEISLNGLTDAQAAQAIAQSYKKGYLKNPRVTVVIVDYAKRRFTILGSVNKPGSFYFPTGESLTLLQAIGMAGGYTRVANPSNILIKRGAQGTKPIKVDGKRMAKEGETKPFMVQPNDVITVGESFF